MKQLIKRSIKYASIILLICFLMTALFYYQFNSKERSLPIVWINTSFIVTILFFCYALIAFVVQRGLFNGIRYSSKQVKATLSKTHKVLLMDENNLSNEDDFKDFMKEKYLYTKPYFKSTYPLLISSTILFIAFSIVSFNM
ncbi:MAG: DUF3899 domain-containing protein [Clostridia bacterium]|nr:DUF3899 domain-containing protein [Clostridia bacterium]